MFVPRIGGCGCNSYRGHDLFSFPLLVFFLIKAYAYIQKNCQKVAFAFSMLVFKKNHLELFSNHPKIRLALPPIDQSNSKYV